MPIDDDYQVALTLRLQTAFAETLENYTSKPARIEIPGDVALAQQWLTIGATYSGTDMTIRLKIGDSGTTGLPRWRATNIGCPSCGPMT